MGSRAGQRGGQLDRLGAVDRCGGAPGSTPPVVAAAAASAITSYMFSPTPVRRSGRLPSKAGHEQRQRVHEVRRQLDQQRALEQRLADQPEVEVLQVAQAAVDQLRRAAGGARGEVVALHQRDAVAARGGVERHAGAGDAAADHDQVEAVALERGERVCARDHGRNVT